MLRAACSVGGGCCSVADAVCFAVDRAMDFSRFEDQLFDTLTEDDESVRISTFLNVSTTITSSLFVYKLVSFACFLV